MPSSTRTPGRLERERDELKDEARRQLKWKEAYRDALVPVQVERNAFEQRLQSLQAAVQAEAEHLRKHGKRLRETDEEHEIPDVVPAALIQTADRLEALLQEEAK